jgi:hypothetical protein
MTTGFDAIRFHYSGAASDGGVQSSEAANLGHYRSASEIDILAPFGAMAGLDIERIGSAADAGMGSLEADGAGKYRWTAPDSTVAGPWVAIAVGAVGVLPDGARADQGARVKRVSTPGAGVESVKLLEIYNGALGLADVTNAQRTAGRSEYRAIFLRNAGSVAQDVQIYLGALGTARRLNAAGYAGAGAVTLTATSGTYKDWPDSGYVQNERTGEVLYYASRTASALTVPAAGRDVWGEVAGGAAGLSGDDLYSVPGLRIALEEPSAQPDGYVQAIADVTTAPAGLTWKHPSNAAAADVLERLALGAGDIVALWLHRAIPAGAQARALVENTVVVIHMES